MGASYSAPAAPGGRYLLIILKLYKKCKYDALMQHVPRLTPVVFSLSNRSFELSRILVGAMVIEEMR